ncbi:AGAP013425-PA [Anopheles gambiae str. PEST]|uniref:AGAP013425-PA n=1 Tax=Anopheles gambiae TaxID=7165 RepID=F5HLE7_ANOGA|nr:AGAP013425-PA [Anopheles gambiae str. PEST]
MKQACSCVLLVLLWQRVAAVLDPLRHNDCHSRAVSMETRILDDYLADQHTVTVIESCTEIPIMSPYCMHNPVPLNAFTLHRFQAFVHQSLEHTTQELEYRTNECFVGSGHMDDLLTELLPYLSEYNPRAKVMLITQEMADQELAELFHAAWYRYRLLQLIVLNHRANDTIESCLFNPFRKALSPELRYLPTGKSDLHCRLLTDGQQLDAYNRELNLFIDDRVYNLNGYPLNIAMHVSNGSTSAYDCILGTVSFTDIDQEILSIMQKQMNFSLILHKNELELSIGYIHQNGTPVGTLGLIEQNAIDLAANSRIIHNYDTRNLLYLHYISTEKLVFITPRNYFRNRDKTQVFINPFSVAYMLTNVLLSFGVPMIIFLLEYAACRLDVPREPSSHTFGTKVLNLVGIIYNVSVKLPRADRKRWIIVGLLVYNIVSYPIWQGVTIRYLHPSNQQVNNINSLEELIETELELKVSHYHEHIVRHEGPHFQSPVYSALSGRLSTRNTSSLRDSIEQIIMHGNSALLIAEEYVPLVLAGNYQWIPGKPDGIWPIQKPIYEFYKSMAVPKTSPFAGTFNAIVLHCVEAGMNDRFKHQLETAVQLMQIRRVREHPSVPDYIVFNMEHLLPLFIFYFAMLLLSGGIFLIELAVHAFQASRARSQQRAPLRVPVEEYVPFEFVH